MCWKWGRSIGIHYCWHSGSMSLCDCRVYIKLVMNMLCIPIKNIVNIGMWIGWESMIEKSDTVNNCHLQAEHSLMFDYIRNIE